MKAFIVVSLTLILTACTGLPEGVKPVKDFDINRYLGTWYEIARLDHSFERGLDSVNATYTLTEDGGVKVVNRGFSIKEKTWKTAEGKAYFVAGQDQGHLKVSFFGPFYSSYVVFELDKQNYQYAFVAGYNTSYLWLLSRTPSISMELLQRFKDQANALGFDSNKLIMVKHDQHQNP